MVLKPGNSEDITARDTRDTTHGSEIKGRILIKESLSSRVCRPKVKEGLRGRVRHTLAHLMGRGISQNASKTTRRGLRWLIRNNEGGFWGPASLF